MSPPYPCFLGLCVSPYPCCILFVSRIHIRIHASLITCQGNWEGFGGLGNGDFLRFCGGRGMVGGIYTHMVVCQCVSVVAGRCCAVRDRELIGLGSCDTGDGKNGHCL